MFLAKALKQVSFMKKPYTFFLTSMVITAIIITSAIYYIFGVIEKDRMINIIDKRMEILIKNVNENDKDMQRFVDQVREDNEDRAKGASLILLHNPGSISSDVVLEEIRIGIGADAINIIDENGKIVAGSDAYSEVVDYDEELFEEFQRALTNTNFYKTVIKTNEDGTYTFKTAVARLDKKGIIEISVIPKNINEIINTLNIASVTSDFPLMESGSTAIIDTETHKFLSHTNSQYIGESVQIPESKFSKDKGTFSSTFKGKPSIIRYLKEEDKIFIGIVNKSEVYTSRNMIFWTLIFVQPILILVGFLAIRTKYIEAREKED